ncbi:methionine--tRNA ligase [Patescibacteria group bacterium]|nr:methionine--tRNA ligase [Patescibacteria group bacterium]MBU1907210.1 methionine--tRNA ligase [Patescibacteria group bacterium]
MSHKFYVTTPIYYVNDKPHVGHIYSTVAADILARYHRMLGEDVKFLTGTDENSQKGVEAAEKAGQEVQTYIDGMAATWQETFDSLGFTNDDFIRTTEDRHLKAVEKFWKAVEKKGDIYEGEYEGFYCTGCEAFVAESDLVDGKCAVHKKAPEKIKEKNYFFKLTKYRDDLLKYIDDNPEFIQPESRRNETLSYIRDFMEDISISRSSMKWGIPVPGDPDQRIYVWFDALINYLSGLGYGTNAKDFKTYWPADVHIVGKDIIKFHCALWPAMLMSAGLPLPKQVFAHGFFTINGDKISKSLGNAIDPHEIVKKYDIDTLRFFLMREIHFGEDGDFSMQRLEERYNTDLANDLGNLVNRVLAMTEKYFDGKVPEKADGFLAGAWPSYHEAMRTLRFHDAIEITWSIVRQANQFVEQQQPWQLAKLKEDKMLADTIYILLETLRHLAWMIYPFMPLTAEKIFTQLGLDPPQEFKESFEYAWVWGELTPGGTIVKGDPLFPRIEN